MLTSGLLLLAFLAWLSVMVLKSVWHQKNLLWKLPPGPTPLPFIGNYLQLDRKQMYNSFLKMSQRYGPVFTVHLGPQRVMVLYGYEAVKEALLGQAEEFSGRGEQATFDWLFGGYGIAFSNGECAKQMKNFALTTMRDFGIGKHSHDEYIQEEARFLIQALQDTSGAFVEPIFYVTKAVSNVICSVVFGNRFDYEDKEFLSLLMNMKEIMKFANTPMGQLFEMFSSVMKHLPGPQQQAFKEMQRLKDFVAKRVDQNQRTLDPSSPRDIIDSFLIHMQKEKNNPHTEFHKNNLLMTTLDFFFGGSESTSITICFGLLLLMKHPDVAEKVYNEIEQVIGRNRQPKFEDRAKMPYTAAVINEIHRFTNVGPMALPHKTTKDTRFRDFFIPKDTKVFIMLSSLLTDPRFFSHPRDFNPQNFLNDKGQLKKVEAFVPFSIGKRSCLGEGLAKMEVFLFITTIMQNFRLKSSLALQDLELPLLASSFSRMLPNYTISFQPR